MYPPDTYSSGHIILPHQYQNWCQHRGARNFNTILYRVLEISTKTYNLLSRKSKFLRNLYDSIRNFLRKSIS